MTINAQVVDTLGHGKMLEISRETLDGENGRTEKMKDEKDDTTSFFALKDVESKPNTKYNLVLRNRDDSIESEDIQFKVIFTEKGWEGKISGSGGNYLPVNINEVMRVKPKVPGLKESSFIQGTKYVMEAFSVASLTPFVPASMKAYQF
jgi:hypothetical protein